MRHGLTTMAALLAGLVGGFLGAHVERARERAQPEQVLRAYRFELLDESGKQVSLWGLDKEHNALLAFGSHWPVGTPEGRASRPVDLTEPTNQRAAFGILDESPFLTMRGTHGDTRMRLNLSIYEKPLLWMGDETGKRLALGLEHSDTPRPEDDNWHLVFEPDRAWIGMGPEKHDGIKYVTGILSIAKDKVKYPYHQ